jgi:hypothetical protein
MDEIKKNLKINKLTWEFLKFKGSNCESGDSLGNNDPLHFKWNG